MQLLIQKRKKRKENGVEMHVCIFNLAKTVCNPNTLLFKIAWYQFE